MILYQKRNFPFLVRLAFVIFHPGMLLIIFLAIGISYLAIHEKTGIAYGMFIPVGFLILVTSFGYYLLIKGAITRLILMEVTPSGLRINQVHYNELTETIIPAKDIQVKLRTSKSRRHSKRAPTPTLTISHKGNSKLTFSLMDNRMVIGKILDGLETQLLVSLRGNEKDLVEYYRS